MADCDLSEWTYATADRAYDIETIFIGSGKLYAAFHPVTEDTTLQELGLYSREGMVFTPEYDAREIMADQFTSPLRTFVHTKKHTFKFQLQELTPFNMTFGYLNPNFHVDVSSGLIDQLCITGEYAEPYLTALFVTPFTWGSKNYQREILIPKAALMSVGDINYKVEEEAVLDLTLNMNLCFDMSGFETKGLLFGIRDKLLEL